MDLKLFYWHLQDTAFIAFIHKGSLESSRFWKSSGIPHAHGDLHFSFKVHYMGFSHPPHTSAEVTLQAELYWWTHLCRLLNILASLGFATATKETEKKKKLILFCAQVAFRVTKNCVWYKTEYWQSKGVLGFTTAYNARRAQFSHNSILIGHNPVHRVKDGLNCSWFWSTRAQGALAMLNSSASFPAPAGRQPGAQWYPQPISCFPSPPSFHHGKLRVALCPFFTTKLLAIKANKNLLTSVEMKSLNRCVCNFIYTGVDPLAFRKLILIYS